MKEPGAMRIWVECYAGHRGKETPRIIHLGERHVDVVDVVDRWHGPDYRYFKVKGGDGAVYILRHDTVASQWTLTMFDRRSDGPP